MGFSWTKESPFYRAVNEYSGSRLVEHWRESRNLALKDIKEMIEPNDPERAKKLTEDVISKVTADSYIIYALTRFAEDSKTN